MQTNEKIENKPKNKIFVYSGTGNCLAMARQIAAQIDAEVVQLTREVAEARHDYVLEVGVVVYPVYGYGMPVTVKNWIKNSTFTIDYLAVLVTYGSHHGGALAEGLRLFKKRGQKVNFSGGAKSVENYISLFGFPKDKMIEARQQNQSEKTAQIIETIKNREENKRNRFRPFSSCVSALFRSVRGFLCGRYKIKGKCTGCQICVKVCPCKVIEITDGKNGEKMPKFDRKNCDHCQACLHACPNKIIKFGRVKPNSKRYRHKDIEISDLLKR